MSPLKKVGSIANQYWQLIHAMLFNLKTIGYVFTGFIFLTLASSLLGIVFPIFYELSLPIALLTFSILFFVGLIAMPMGMMMLLANRHVFALANLRNKLFVIAFTFCFLASLIIALSPFFLKNNIPSLSMMFFVLMFCALYFWSATYLGSKKFEVSLTVPAIMAPCLNVSFKVFISLNPIILLVMGLALWVLFYRWWMIFTPNRPRAKSILIETDRVLQGMPIQKLFYFPFSRVRTAMGSLLLGYGDGVASLIIRLSCIYIAVLIFSLFIFSGLIGEGSMHNTFMATIVALAYSFFISAIDFNGRRMLMNVKRSWLVFSGTRKDLFLYLESNYLRSIFFLVLFNFVAVILLVIGSNNTQYFFYCIGALLGFTVSVILLFYVDIYFYKRGELAPGTVNLSKAMAIIVCFAPIVFYLIFKYQKVNIFEAMDALAISLVIVILASLKTIRSKSLEKWQAANF